MANTHPARATSGRFRRLFTSALLALSVVAGTLAATATPADAATSVRACFRSTQGYNLWSVQATLAIWFPGYGWLAIDSRPLGPNNFGLGHCAYWPIDLPDYHFTVFVDYRAHGVRWVGNPPSYDSIAYPGYYHEELGLGTVTCIGC